jgi:hypothetical protein
LLLQAVIKLQQAFSQLGSHLTHLSFGVGNNPMHLQLSAPLNRMPALQTLITQTGFTLDAEDILYSDLDLGQPDPGQHADLNGSSDSAAAAAAAPLVPSLTRLVLNDGYDHGQLFQLLTQPSREGLAAAASRTLLQQLEINSNGELSFELLNQLEGLRSLKFTVSQAMKLLLHCFPARVFDRPRISWISLTIPATICSICTHGKVGVQFEVSALMGKSGCNLKYLHSWGSRGATKHLDNSFAALILPSSLLSLLLLRFHLSLCLYPAVLH